MRPRPPLSKPAAITVTRISSPRSSSTIAPKMMWVRDAFPDVYRRTAKFVTVSGYLLGKLAGQPADAAVVDAPATDAPAAEASGTVTGRVLGSESGAAVTAALYLRFLKRVSAHLKNVATSVVNPYYRIGFREKNPTVKSPPPPSD